MEDNSNVQHTQQVEKPSAKLDFGLAYMQGVDFNDISFGSKKLGIPVVMPTQEEFAKRLPENTTLEQHAALYDQLKNEYIHYESGEYDRNTGHLEVGGRLPEHTFFKQLGLPTMAGPDWEKQRMRNTGEYVYGAGYSQQPFVMNHRDMIAEQVGYFMTRDGKMVENTRLNRMGKMLVAETNPDENSDLPYIWRERDEGEFVNGNDIRTIFGPRETETGWFNKLLNLRSAVGGMVGMTYTATGGLVGSLGTIADAVWNTDYNYYNPNSFASKLGNSLTNHGSYFTHQNTDEQVGMFESTSGFSYGLYQGIGQLFSMGLTSRMMINVGAPAGLTTFASLGLGSAQMGGSIYKQIRESGGNEMDAALAFYAFAASTYAVNMVLGANLAQKIGLKKSINLATKQTKQIAEPYSKLNKSFNSLSPQTKATASSAMSNNIIKTAWGIRGKIDDFLLDLSERYIQTPLGKLRYGYMLGTGLEEFGEEALEELVQSPMGKAYNKYLAVPRAKEVIENLSGFDYAIHYDDYGNPHYYKEDQRTGNRIPLEWNVWQDEKKSIEMAQNIVSGNFPLDEEFSWDEPFAALISSFVGGQPMFYISGGHLGRKHNDKKNYRQLIALDIAQKGKNQRKSALKEVRKQLETEQERHNIFGSNNITPDGNIVNAGEAGSISMAQHAIDSFMADLQLDIENIDAFKINSPEVLLATRQNRYIATEALNTVHAINTIRQAIDKANEAKQGTIEGIPEYVADGTSIAAAEKQLEGRIAEFKYITEPGDGVGGKLPSKYYSDLHQSEQALEYIFKHANEVKAEEYFKKKGQEITEEFRKSDKFKKKAESFYKEMLNDQGTVLSLAWMANAKDIKVGNEWIRGPIGNDGRISIPKHMRNVFHNILQGEMQAVLNKMKESETKSDESLKNVGEFAKNFESKLKNLMNIDFAKYENWTDTSVKDFDVITQEIGTLNSMLDELNTAGSYNAITGETAESLTNMFNALAKSIAESIDSIETLSDNHFDAKMGEKITKGYAPSNNLLALSSALKDQLSEIDTRLKLPTEQKTRLPKEVTELDQASLNQVRLQAFMNLGQGQHSFNLKQGDKPNAKSFSEIVKEYSERINQAENEIADIENITANLQAIEQNMLYVMQVADFNRGFLQDYLKGDALKHSPLEDGKSEHLKLTAEEAQQIKDSFEAEVMTVRALLNNEKLTKLSRELGWTKDQLRDLAIRNLLLSKIVAEEKDAMTKETLSAYDEIGQLLGEDQKKKFENLLKKYTDKYENADIARRNKDEVIAEINKIHAAVVKAESTLSGKLGNFISTYLRNYVKGSISDHSLGYNDLLDYQKGIKFQRAGEGITGPLTQSSMINPTSNDEASIHHHYVLTWANNLNRLGKPIHEGGPSFTLDNIMQAYRDVLAEKFLQKEASDQSPVASNDNTATYEQEQAVLHLVNYLLYSHDNLLHNTANSDALKKIILNTIFVRGYAGTGKTEQVVYDAIRTYNKLAGKTGKDKSITIIAPAQRLLDIHKKNESKIISEEDVAAGAKVKYITQAEFIDNKGKVETDLYIVDEASLFSHDDLNKIRDNIKDKKGLWLGDDAQTPPMTINSNGKHDYRNNTILAIHSWSGERTVPVTEIFRSGNPDIFSLQDYFRKMFTGFTSSDYPTLRYAKDDAGRLHGGRYYKTDAELRESFYQQYSLLEPQYKNHLNIIYIVPTHTDVQAVIAEFKKEFNDQEFLSKLETLVYSAEYVKGTSTVVSGLSAAQVFFQFDPNKFANQKWLNDYNDFDVNDPKSDIHLKTLVGRIGLTGVSRATSFIGMLNSDHTEKNHKEVTIDKIPQSALTVPENTKIDRRDMAVERLTLAVGKSTYENSKAKETGGTPPEVLRKHEEVKNRDLFLTDAEKKNISESKSYQKLRNDLEHNNAKKIEQENYLSATDLAVKIGIVQQAISKTDPQYAKYKKENQLKSNFYSLVARYSIAAKQQKESLRQQALALVDQINAEYKKIYADDADKLKKATIENAEKYFNAVYQNIHLLVSQTSLDIINPTFLNEGIDMVIDGKVQNVKVSSHPAIVKVVGKTSDGKYIVNIEDFVFHRSGSSSTLEPGVYTKAKMGMYATLLSKNGYIVNSVTIRNFLTQGTDVESLADYTMTDNMLYDGIEMVYEHYFKGVSDKEQMTSLASEEILNENNRSIPNDKYKTGFYYSNNKGHIVRVIDVVQTKEGVDVYYANGRSSKVLKMSYDKFSSYVPIKQSEDYDGLKYKSRAGHFDTLKKKKGINTSHVHGISLLTSQTDQYVPVSELLKTKEQQAKLDIMANVLSNQNNYDLVQIYNETIKGFDSKGMPRNYNHVITLEIVKDSIEKNIGAIRVAFKKHGLYENLSDDELIQKVVDERYYVLGQLNAPEYQFYKNTGEGVSILDNTEIKKLYDSYLAETNKQKESEVFEQIMKHVSQGFKNDQFAEQLIKYNEHKIKHTKAVKNSNTGISAIIESVIPGAVKAMSNDEKQPLTSLINKVQSKGYKFVKVEKAVGGNHFTVNAIFEKEGIGEINIVAEGMPVNVEYVRSLQSQLSDHDYIKEISEGLERIDSIVNNLDSIEDADELLRSESRAVKTLIEETGAYQFLMANRAGLIQFLDENNISDGSKIVQWTSSLGKTNIEIAGNKASDKIRNLDSVLTSIINEMEKQTSKLKLFADPWTIDYSEESQTGKAGKLIPNVETLVTAVDDIKNPELFISDDQKFVPDQNDIKLYDDQTESDGEIKEIDSSFFNDDDEVPLEKSNNNFLITQENVQNVEAAINEVASFIGKKNANSVVKLEIPQIKSTKDIKSFGRVVDGILHLTGFDFNGQLVVEHKTARHESAHFVMLYMLDQKQVDKVIESVKKELGDNWDGTMRHIYEFVAESFETFEKPKTLWGKFVQRIKEFGNWLGVRYFDYKEMMAGIDRGYYVDSKIHAQPNHTFEALYKKPASKYGSAKQRDAVINLFGNWKVYNHIINTELIPVLMGNMPGGKSFSGSASNTFAGSLAKTVETFRNRQIVNGNDIGTEIYRIDEKNVAVKDMTPIHFKKMVNNKTIYKNGINRYISYHLGKNPVLFTMIADVFPNKIPEKLYRDAIGKNTGIDTKGGGNSIHSHAENQSAFQRANDLLDLQLRTIPYYVHDIIDRAIRKNNDATAMVPKKLVNMVMIDVVGNAVNRLNKDPYELTVQDILKELINYTESEASGQARDAALSIFREFGNRARKVVVKDKDGREIQTLHKDHNGMASGTGYFYLANPEMAKKHDEETSVSSFHWRDKSKYMWDVLSAFRNHYVSMYVNTSAIVNFDNGKIENRNHRSESIQKIMMKGQVEERIFNGDKQTVNDKFIEHITTENNPDKLIHLDENGFSVSNNWVIKRWSSLEDSNLEEGKFEVIYDKNNETKSIEGLKKAEHISDVLNVLGINIGTLNSVNRTLRKEEEKALKQDKTKSNEVPLTEMLHTFLLAAKVNHAATQAINEIIDDKENIIRKYFDVVKKYKSPEGELTIEQITDTNDQQIFRRAEDALLYSRGPENLMNSMIREKLSEKDRILYDEILKKYKSAKVAMETQIDMPEYNVLFSIPSPLDFYQYFESMAKVVSKSSGIEGPQSTTKPDGTRVFTVTPGSALSKYGYGSNVVAGRITNDILSVVQNMDESVNKMYAANHPIYNGTSGDMWLNPILADLVGFDGFFDFHGVVNKYRGYNFKDMTDKDLSLAIVEEFFGKDIIAKRSFMRINVLMSVLSDKNKAPVMPFFFKGSRSAETISPIISEGKKLSVNKSAFIKPFDLLIKSYKKRQLVAKNELLSQIKNEPALKDIENLKGEVLISKETAIALKRNLEVGKHYFLKETEIANPNGTYSHTEYSFRLGNTITLTNTPFTTDFFTAWEAAQGDQKYNLLRMLVANDFGEWLSMLKKNGAIEALSKSKILPPNMLSTFEDVDLDQLIDVLDDNGKNKKIKEKFTTSANSITLELNEKLSAERNRWLQENRYDESGNVVAEGDFVPMTVDILNSLEDTNIKDSIYDRMRKDKPFSKIINRIKSEGSKLSARYTKKGVSNAIKAPEKSYWPPALEVLYMTYWLANESVSHLERGNPTGFKNPNDFVKRGAGLNAPGTGYDTSNPNGIGEHTLVATFSDIPGYNEFLNVKKGDPKTAKVSSELFSNGVSNLSPVHNILFKRSSGGDMGLHGDNSNKTVVYGHDHLTDRHYYFKHSQRPVSEFEYNNSEFYRQMVKSMLGDHYSVFESILNHTKSFKLASEYTADYAVNPEAFINRLSRIDDLRDIAESLTVLINSTWDRITLPRDQMIGYLQHSSTFKQGAYAINDYEYANQNDYKDVSQIIFPERLNIKTVRVPNSFMRLQVVNNGDGNSDVHSFATQLFSMIGVQEWNHANAKQFNEALEWKAMEFVREYNDIVTKSIDDKLDPYKQEEKTRKQLLNYVKSKVLENGGGSLKGTKMNTLLLNSLTVGDVFGPKLFESMTSFLNDHLKPKLPGHNAVQNPSLIKFNVSEGQLYTEADGMAGEQRMLKPLSYYDKSGNEFTDRDKFNKYISEGDNHKNVVVAPAEVIMKFHYADKFNLPPDISLQEAMSLIFNGKRISLYETGLQRSLGLGAKRYQDVVKIFVNNGINTNKELLDSFKSDHMRNMFAVIIKNIARKNIKNTPELQKSFSKETKERQDQMIELIADSYLDQNIFEQIKTTAGDDVMTSAFAQKVAEYYIDLNDALDVITVRIPTTNASSAAIGRIVAFANIGNTILTSAEKSILDGSDYDHDELHTFYPELSGRKRVRNNEKQADKSNNNKMFDSFYSFYLEARNHEMVLSPIDLTTIRNEVDDSNVRPFANTMTHNLEAFKNNMAGMNIVGHLANQMTFTTKLMSTPSKELKKQVHPGMKMILTPGEYSNTIDFIGRLVNVAIDNANENGLLGRLNITEDVTSLIAGMTLYTVTNATTLQSIQKQVLDRLKESDIQKIAAEVALSRSAKNLRAKKKVYDVIADRIKSEKNDLKKAKYQELLDYAHAGEQLIRLGNIYKLTQNISGNKYDYDREIYNIKKALGYTDLEQFLKDAERGIDFGDYSNSDKRREAALKQFENSKELLVAKEIDDADIREREIGIREKINIPRVVSKNPMLLAQIRALVAFNDIVAEIDTSNNLSDVKSAFLEWTKQPELLYEDGHRSYENTIRKLMIGTHMSLHADTGFAVTYYNNAKNKDNVKVYNMRNAKDQMLFIANFSKFIDGLKKRYGKNNIATDFLSKIEFEKYGDNNIPIANFRNSIYTDDSEKIYYLEEFKRLANEGKMNGEDIGQAFRYYQALVYGFAYRNGSFNEVIDTKFETFYSENYDTTLNALRDRLANDKENLLTEMGVLSPDALTKIRLGSTYDSESLKPNIVNTYDDYGNEGSILMIPTNPNHGKIVNHDGYMLVMPIFPNSLYVYSPGQSFTHDFVYPGLSKAELMEFHEQGTVLVKRLNGAGIEQNAPVDSTHPFAKLNEYGQPYDGTKYIKNRPYDNSYVVTALGDVGKLEYIDNRSFILKNDAVIKESRVTTQNSAMSGHSIDILTEIFKTAFKGIEFNYVNNHNSLTNGIAYFQNGKVFINRDKIQTDTHFHEITHALLPIIKSEMPSLYSALKRDAQILIDSEDAVVITVAKKYPELSGEDFIEEIIATVTGFNNAKKVEDFLAGNGDNFHEVNSKSFWARLKNRINTFWSTIGKLFNKRAGINIDADSTTIKSFSDDLFKRVMSGQQVMNITTGALKRIAATAYSNNINEQRSTQISSAMDLYDAMLNTGKIVQGDNEEYVKQIRNLSQEERVRQIKYEIKSSKDKTYKVKGQWDNTIDFSGVDESEWNRIIIDNILKEQDIQAKDLKDAFMEIANTRDGNIYTMQEKLGKDKLGKHRYSATAIKKLFNAVAYNPATKYYRYSELPKELQSLFNEELVGFDPIIAIEHNSDNQMVISLFNITRDYIGKRDYGANKKETNILANYYTNSEAKIGRFFLHGNVGNASNVLMGLIASKFNTTGKEIMVRDISTIYMTPKNTEVKRADTLELQRVFEGMSKAEKFTNDLSPGMIKTINDYTHLTNGFNYTKLLIDKFGQKEFYKGYLDDVKNDVPDIGTMKQLLTERLRQLRLGQDATYDDTHAFELEVIMKALAFYNSGVVISSEMNSTADAKALEVAISPSFDVNHLVFDTVRRLTIETNQKNVVKQIAFKNKIDDFAQFFYDRNNKFNYIVDKNWGSFEEILAKVKDQNGIDRYAGSVLWTTDSNLDPMFAEQARQLSPELLEKGKFVVETINEIMIDYLMHDHYQKHGSMIYRNGESVKFTREIAKDILFNEMAYRPGMIPLMHDTVNMLMGRGHVYRALEKRTKQIQSSFIDYEEMKNLSDTEKDLLDTIPEIFTGQFYRKSGDPMGSLGNSGSRMYSMLGLIEQDGKFIYSDTNSKVQDINTDLENLLEFFHLAVNRKISYEKNVLPVINGAKLFMLDLQNNRDFSQANILKYMDAFVEQAIEGKHEQNQIEVADVKIHPVVKTVSAVASPLVMALNINVGIVSAIHNSMMAFIEGASNSMFNTFTDEEKSHWFGAGHIAKASGITLTDFHKVSQLLRDMQLMNPNEYELVMHRYHNQKRRKHIFSDFYAQIFNWGADYYARGVVMTAQMLKDGSYKAWEYDKDKGSNVYDEKKDSRLFQEDGTQTKEQKILYDALKKRLVDEGFELNPDGTLTTGYSLAEMRSFKALADKHIVGAYGPIERGILGHTMVGKMAGMFTTWFMTKVSNAYKQGSFIDELGYYKITMDVHGNYIPQWQREWTEGYLNTVWRYTKALGRGDMAAFKNMQPHEKKNIIKYALTVATFLSSWIAYGLFVEDPERRKRLVELRDTDPEKYEEAIKYWRWVRVKLGMNAEGYIDETRAVKNAKYALASLFVIPIVLEKLDSPFAVTGIVRRSLSQGTGLLGGDWEKLKYTMPAGSGYFTVEEQIKVFTDK